MDSVNSFQYYVIDSANGPFPLIAPQEDSRYTMHAVRAREKLENPELMVFRYCEPFIKNPVHGDYFDASESVVSAKIADVLRNLQIHSIQLLPAVVYSDKNEQFKDCFYVHIHRYIKAVNRKKSSFTVDAYDPDMLSIDSFVLDESALAPIPLADRLVFKLAEDSTMKLYHETVVRAVLAAKPSGLMFTAVEDWSF